MNARNKGSWTEASGERFVDGVWISYLPRAMGVSVRLGEDLLINRTGIHVSITSTGPIYRASVSHIRWRELIRLNISHLAYR